MILFNNSYRLVIVSKQLCLRCKTSQLVRAFVIRVIYCQVFINHHRENSQRCSHRTLKWLMVARRGFSHSSTIARSLYTWWHYGVETISALLVLCEGNTSMRAPYHCLFIHKQMKLSLLLIWTRCCNTVELPVICDVMTFLWRHFDA